MKVAALVERRDRIMKNRRIAKCRKKSTTTPPTCNEVASASASSPLSSAAASVTEVEVPKSTETHELKIKTVFQRHKQEHHEQEEAAAIRTVRKTIVLSLFSSRPQMCCVWVTARCWQCMQCTVMFDTHIQNKSCEFNTYSCICVWRYMHMYLHKSWMKHPGYVTKCVCISFLVNFSVRIFARQQQPKFRSILYGSCSGQEYQQQYNYYF